MGKGLRERFQELMKFGELLTAKCQEDIRASTGIANFQCFVNDQFEASFPEDHLMRDGQMMLSLRLSLDLKGFGSSRVNRLKQKLLGFDGQILRANFQDSIEQIGFDWHITERDKEGEVDGKLLRLYQDVLKLHGRLQELMTEKP